MVIMKWGGTDEQRRDITTRYLRTGPEGILSGGMDPSTSAVAECFVRDVSAQTSGQQGTSNPSGTAGDQGTGNGTPVASRAQRDVSDIAQYRGEELAV